MPEHGGGRRLPRGKRQDVRLAFGHPSGATPRPFCAITTTLRNNVDVDRIAIFVLCLLETDATAPNVLAPEAWRVLAAVASRAYLQTTFPSCRSRIKRRAAALCGGKRGK